MPRDLSMAVVPATTFELPGSSHQVAMNEIAVLIG
jgi:hypothetical protein